LLLSILVVLGLSACERPAPGSQAPQATATLPAIIPSLPPSLGASPTPLIAATLDPNAPVGASPTPEGVVDPNAAASPTPPPPAPEPTTASTEQTSATGEIIHVVQPGENLYRIGLRYGIDYHELAAYNGIANPDWISVGQQIRIPPTP
jgi:nucleoid-associated protein YgaU